MLVRQRHPHEMRCVLQFSIYGGNEIVCDLLTQEERRAFYTISFWPSDLCWVSLEYPEINTLRELLDEVGLPHVTKM